jgi:hypothetical protein
VTLCDRNCRSAKWLLDHLVGVTEQRQRDTEPKGLGGLEVDGNLEAAGTSAGETISVF